MPPVRALLHCSQCGRDVALGADRDHVVTLRDDPSDPEVRRMDVACHVAGEPPPSARRVPRP